MSAETLCQECGWTGRYASEAEAHAARVAHIRTTGHKNVAAYGREESR